jgi:hypothetical protein
MSIDSVDTFLAILQRAQVLTPQEVQDVARELGPHFTSPHELARYLAEIDWLTAYQVRLLFSDRWGELTIGPYLILDRLGEGGVSEVFKAWDTVKGRPVALKVLHQHLTNRSAAVRELQRELQAVTRLSHPNIIRTFDAHQVGEVSYFAMEFVEGLDLERYVRRSGQLCIPGSLRIHPASGPGSSTCPSAGSGASRHKTSQSLSFHTQRSLGWRDDVASPRSRSGD